MSSITTNNITMPQAIGYLADLEFLWIGIAQILYAQYVREVAQCFLVGVSGNLQY